MTRAVLTDWLAMFERSGMEQSSSDQTKLYHECADGAAALSERSGSRQSGSDRTRHDAADSVWAPGHRGLTAGLVATITLFASESLAVSTVLPYITEDQIGRAHV